MLIEVRRERDMNPGPPFWQRRIFIDGVELPDAKLSFRQGKGVVPGIYVNGEKAIKPTLYIDGDIVMVYDEG